MSTATAEELQQQSLTVPEKARAIVIANAADYQRAADLLITIKGLRHEIDQTFDPIIGKAHEAHKEALAQKKRADNPLQEAEAILKPRIAGYLQEQERLRQAEQLRLEKEARDEAERQQIADASLLHDIGEVELANRVLDRPIETAPIVAPVMVPKVSGIIATTRYSATVTDLMELVKAVAAGKVNILALQANTVFLNQQARSLKEFFSIPGVRLDKDNGISARR